MENENVFKQLPDASQGVGPFFIYLRRFAVPSRAAAPP
jgi:hypothetical protein